jgi:hypothetical protein
MPDSSSPSDIFTDIADKFKTMRRFRLILICTMSLLSGSLWGQNSMPVYLDVVKEFFSNYSHEREEPNDRIFFARKKDGWYVDIADISKNDSIKGEQLFWNSKGKKYTRLTGFGKGLSNEKVEEKIDSSLTSSDPPFLYGYQRCRYFGYAGWDKDMIRDFGGTTLANDTLLEGLARAYGAYAEKFLWNGVGYGTFNSDTLVRKLGRLEIPGPTRVDSFMYYINKGIDCYRRLAKINPGFKVLVGNIPMKILNEQMHQYLQLSISGYMDKLKKIIDELPANDTIYQQIGYAYLNACPLNSILITYGDNDTYPLWYVQEKKGFRKDVTVLNYSLLGVAPYINMLKRNNKVQFSSTAAFYGKERFDYFPYDESGPPNITNTSLPAFIKDLQKIKHSYISGPDTLPAYQVKTIDLTIDLLKLKKICNQNNLLPKISIELTDYILLNDFMILDILNSNLDSRPICFTSTESFLPKGFMQREGLIYRFLPLNEKLKDVNAKTEISKTEAYLLKNNKPILAAYYDREKYYEDALFGKHSDLFATIITYYNENNKPDKSNEWASRYLASFDPISIRYSLSDIVMAEALLKTSFQKQAVSLLENIATNLVAGYKNHDLFPLIYKKDTCKQYLEFIKSILSAKNQSSDVLEKLIEEFNKEDEE